MLFDMHDQFKGNLSDASPTSRLEARMANLIDRNTTKPRELNTATGIRIYPLEDIAPSTISNILILSLLYAAEIGAIIESTLFSTSPTSAMGHKR